MGGKWLQFKKIRAQGGGDISAMTLGRWAEPHLNAPVPQGWAGL